MRLQIREDLCNAIEPPVKHGAPNMVLRKSFFFFFFGGFSDSLLISGQSTNLPGPNRVPKNLNDPRPQNFHFKPIQLEAGSLKHPSPKS